MIKRTGAQELKNVVTFQKGKPPVQQPYFGPDAELYLTPEYLRGGCMTEPIKASSNAVRISDGETIVLWDGSNAGEVFRGREGVLSSTMTRLKPVTSFDRQYFFYAVKQWEAFLKGQTSGSGIPHVDKEVLGNLRVLDFSKPEQAKISEILSTVDRALEQTEALIAKQQRIKVGVMQDLLTRGIDEHGNLRSEQTHKFKDSLLGRIPAEWKAGSILDFSSRARQAILTGPFGAQLGSGDFVEEGVPVLRIGNVQAGYVDQSSLLFVSEQKAAGLSRYRIEAGDLLFARQGATTGRNSLASSQEDGFLINYHIIRVAIDQTKCSPTFLYAAFNSEKVQGQVEQEKGKGTREGVNTATLMAFVLPIPPMKEQLRLSDVIDAHRRQTDAVVFQSNKLRALRTALMQVLLTGKKPVTPLLELQTTH
jgi:type I restriction enzyme S subunit